jgi:hypothetical protein
MPATVRHFLAIAAFVPLLFAVSDASAQLKNMNASSMEIALIPHFCWGQFEVPNATGPEFNFPPQSQCGPAMNHYCPGLLQLIRAKRASNKRDRFYNFGQADANIRYTENAIKDYPSCALREHVAASRAELNSLMTVFGYQGRRPK